MQQEPADEFHRADGEVFGALFLSVFGRKSHHTLFELLDTTICDRYPMGGACQIFQHIIGAFDRIADTDDPYFFKERVFEFLIGLRIKLKLMVLASLAHEIDELAAEDQR